jgi:hypothetical protein
MKIKSKYPDNDESNNCFISMSVASGYIYLGPGLVELMNIKEKEKVELWETESGEWLILKGDKVGFSLRGTSNINDISLKIFSLKFIKTFLEKCGIEDVMSSSRFVVEKDPIEFEGRLINT